MMEYVVLRNILRQQTLRLSPEKTPITGSSGVGDPG